MHYSGPKALYVMNTTQYNNIRYLPPTRSQIHIFVFNTVILIFQIHSFLGKVNHFMKIFIDEKETLVLDKNTLFPMKEGQPNSKNSVQVLG